MQGIQDIPSKDKPGIPPPTAYYQMFTNVNKCLRYQARRPGSLGHDGRKVTKVTKVTKVVKVTKVTKVVKVAKVVKVTKVTRIRI